MTQMLTFDLDAEELEVFCLEAEEMTGYLDADLLSIEQGAETDAVIQRLFRSAHTLKGSAGAIGHHRMADLTHSMETVLELLRQKQLTVSPELVDLLLQGVDMLRALTDEVSTGAHSGADPADLVDSLKSFVASQDGVSRGSAPDDETASDEPALFDMLSREVMESTTGNIVQVRADIDPDSISSAARALQVLLALEECGTVLQSNPDRTTIESGADIQCIEVLATTSDDADTVRERLSRVGELTRINVSEMVSEEENSTPSQSEAEPTPAGGKPLAQTARVKTFAAKTVRTSVERLDKLMNLVGELVTDRNRLLQTHNALSMQFEGEDFLGDLAQAISHLANITDELQDEVMRARMLPLENVFQKFPRMVRDLAREAGKEITLQIEGQETELDRSVIEEIADPLLHLIRNAVDHGTEMPAERRAAGKPENAVVRLAGRSEGNHIIITVADEGRGIDAARLRAKAVERGFMSEEAAQRLSDSEAIDLIFLPGLSTAKQVTDVSGRGVGMDVVRTNIERLHGSVNVKSEPGKGTVFELSLPLTLAIMPVLLVELLSEVYCIPLTAVTEVVEIDTSAIHHVDRGEIVVWRGRQLPLIRLSRFYDLNGRGSSQSATNSVVAVRHGEEHVGLVVDGLQGQQEIVIKNLGTLIGQIPGISGGTILGDGSVALIVDVPGLVKHASRMAARQVSASV